MYNHLEPLMIASFPSSITGENIISSFENNTNNNNATNNTTNIINREQEEEQEERSRLRSYCFPDTFSTSSGPSVNSYLRKVYGDSIASSSNVGSRTNSNYYNNNRLRSNTNNSVYYNNYYNNINNTTNNDNSNDTMSSTTMDPEERRVLVNHLNEYSFETLKESSTESNNTNTSSNNNNKQKRKENDDDNICPRTPSPVNLNNGKNTNITTYPNNNIVPIRRGSFVPGSILTTNNNMRRPSLHKKSNAISLSKEFDQLQLLDHHTFNTPPTPPKQSLKQDPQMKINKVQTPFERFKDIYMGDYDDDDDDNSPISPLSYPHHLSPIKTIDNTREQIKRNSKGEFKSLNDFANFNNINTKGKNFIIRPMSPKINLEENNFLPL